MHVGILYSRVRVEEKLLFEAFARRGVELDLLDDQHLVFDITDVESHPYKDFDVIVERCINHSRALYSLKILNDQGVRTVNTAEVADICGNKLLTTSALAAAGVPQPKVRVAYTPESALKAIERAGLPGGAEADGRVVGAAAGKVNDRDAAEAILEHKETLGSYHHSHLLHPGVRRRSRGATSARSSVGDETICAIYRTSAHWITNTARGGSVEQLSDHAGDRPSCAAGGARRAAAASSRSTCFEDPDRGLLVNEVNYTMEFRNSIAPTGVDIPGRDRRLHAEGGEGRLGGGERLEGRRAASHHRDARRRRVGVSGDDRSPRGVHRRRVRLCRRRTAAARCSAIPGVEVRQATASGCAGQFVHSIHPNLRRRDDAEVLERRRRSSRAICCSWPAARRARWRSIERFASLAGRIVDLSADFRLRTRGGLRRWYGKPHASPAWLGEVRVRAARAAPRRDCRRVVRERRRLQRDRVDAGALAARGRRADGRLARRRCAR